MKWWLSFALLVSLPACSLDRMAARSRLRPYETSPVFADGRLARPPVPGTVARGQLDPDTGAVLGSVDRAPFALTRADLERGREAFEVHCSPCHGRTGLGNGMIVQRGLTPPPSYFLPRLKAAPLGHFVEVITQGFGAMASYADQVALPDRWRIAAYIRALQGSRGVPIAQVPAQGRRELEGRPR